MKRRKLTAKARLELFQSHGGVCHLCGVKIQVGEAWEVEHVIALATGGDDEIANMAPAHVKCHREKTTTDVAVAAKIKRIQQKHFGAKEKKPWSKWRRKMNGEVVER